MVILAKEDLLLFNDGKIALHTDCCCCWSCCDQKPAGVRLTPNVNCPTLPTTCYLAEKGCVCDGADPPCDNGGFKYTDYNKTWNIPVSDDLNQPNEAECSGCKIWIGEWTAEFDDARCIPRDLSFDVMGTWAITCLGDDRLYVNAELYGYLNHLEGTPSFPDGLPCWDEAWGCHIGAVVTSDEPNECDIDKTITNYTELKTDCNPWMRSANGFNSLRVEVYF